MPKKPHRHHKHPKLPHKHTEPTPPEQDCTAFLDEEICIEAKVTVNPEVSVGKVKIECVESTIEKHPKHKKASEECTVYVNQLIRVKIPIRFSAKAEAEKKGIICRPSEMDESSDESSSSSS